MRYDGHTVSFDRCIIVGMEGPFMRLYATFAAHLVLASVAFGHGRGAPDLTLLRELEPIFELEHGPNVAQRAWVTINVLTNTGGPARVRGWLIGASAESATLLHPSGETERFRRAAAGEKPGDDDTVWLTTGDRTIVSDITTGSFEAYCREMLKAAEANRSERALLVGDITTISTLRAAVWEMQRGQLGLAQDLLHLANQITPRPAKTEKADKKEKETAPAVDLVRIVASSMAAQRKERALDSVLAGATRPQTLAIWESVVRLGSHPLSTEANDMVRHYRSLIAEDKAWSEPADVDVGLLDDRGKVAYWMHHLRDAELHQNDECFGRFPRGGDERPNPVQKLTELGLAAVPALIEHMDDERPTCSFYYSRWGRTYQLRYGDFCQQIFDAITHRTARDGNHPIRAGKGAANKKRAQEWWRDFQELGEVGMLKRTAEAGDEDSVAAAVMLLEKNPAAALDSIAVGIRRAKGSHREGLVALLGGIGSKRSTPFLLEELTGPCRESRIAAASMLVQRKNPAGVAALVKEWTTAKADALGSTDLLTALLATGDPLAVRALGQRWQEASVNDRVAIIEELHTAPKAAPGAAGNAADASRLVDDLLARALDERDRSGTNILFCTHGKMRHCNRPAVRDLAARALVDRWQQPAKFDLFAGTLRRERSLREVKNDWLVRNGREPLPIEPAPTVEAVPYETVKPLIDAWSHAMTPDEQSAAAQKLDLLGPSAVLALKRVVNDETLDGPTRAYAAAARGRFADTVRDVRLATHSPPLPAEVRRRVDALKDRSLEADRFGEMLSLAVETWPAGATTLSIVLEREEGEAGFVLAIGYLPGVRSQESEFAPLPFQESLRLAGQPQMEREGKHPGCGRSKDGWTGLSFGIVQSLDEVLRSNADASVYLSLVYGDRPVTQSGRNRWIHY
jgi:hypothetical protein